LNACGGCLRHAEYARRLQDAGIAAPQAEAQARALADALTGRVASPSDLDALEARLVSRIDAFDRRLNGRIDGLEGRIDALDSRLNGRIDGLEGRIDGRIEKLAGSVDTLKWLVGLLTAFNIATFARVMLH
jgi:hypothetical protein